MEMGKIRNGRLNAALFYGKATVHSRTHAHSKARNKKETFSAAISLSVTRALKHGPAAACYSLPMLNSGNS
jgi:hypothetical protein